MTDRGLSVIVPAYNEAENITSAVAGIAHALLESDLYDWQIILVDDGSTDGTARAMDRMAATYVGVQVVHHPRNLGLRAAYETGLSLASQPYATWVPGDGEMATESLTDIFRAIGTADLVVPYHGTPERRGWFRRLLTFVSTWELNLLLGHNLHYFQGTACMSTALARSLPRTEPGFFFNAEMLCHALDMGLTYVEIPLIHTDRQHGVSKAVSARAIWRAQMLILRLWWRLRVRPLVDVVTFGLEVGR